MITKFCEVSRSDKKTKYSEEKRRGVGWFKTPSNSLFAFFPNSPLLNGLNPNIGNIAYSGKISKLGEKKFLIWQKKKTLSKIAAPGSTSSVSYEAVLSNKDENRKGQLFIKSLK